MNVRMISNLSLYLKFQELRLKKDNLLHLLKHYSSQNVNFFKLITPPSFWGGRSLIGMGRKYTILHTVLSPMCMILGFPIQIWHSPSYFELWHYKTYYSNVVVFLPKYIVQPIYQYRKGNYSIE